MIPKPKTYKESTSLDITLDGISCIDIFNTPPKSESPLNAPNRKIIRPVGLVRTNDGSVHEFTAYEPQIEPERKLAWYFARSYEQAMENPDRDYVHESFRITEDSFSEAMDSVVRNHGLVFVVHHDDGTLRCIPVTSDRAVFLLMKVDPLGSLLVRNWPLIRSLETIIPRSLCRELDVEFPEPENPHFHIDSDAIETMEAAAIAMNELMSVNQSTIDSFPRLLRTTLFSRNGENVSPEVMTRLFNTLFDLDVDAINMLEDGLEKIGNALRRYSAFPMMRVVDGKIYYPHDRTTSETFGLEFDIHMLHRAIYDSTLDRMNDLHELARSAYVFRAVNVLSANFGFDDEKLATEMEILLQQSVHSLISKIGFTFDKEEGWTLPRDTTDYTTYTAQRILNELRPDMFPAPQKSAPDLGLSAGSDFGFGLDL